MYGARLNVANMLQALTTPTLTSQNVTLSGESAIKIKIQGNDYLYG